MASFLVVANKTLGGEGLAAHLRHVIKSNPVATFVVVVPFSSPVPVDAGGAMGGIAVIDLETEEYLEATARGRLDALLAWLRDAGVDADRPQYSNPADSEQPFLPQPKIGTAGVQLAQQHPILGVVLLEIGVEQVEWNPSHFHGQVEVGKSLVSHIHMVRIHRTT